jgi:hypothetical protein
MSILVELAVRGERPETTTVRLVQLTSCELHASGPSAAVLGRSE